MLFTVYGKPSGPWGSVLTAFAEGIASCGFAAVWRNPSVFTADQTMQCNVAVVLGQRGPAKEILTSYRALYVPALVIDAGYLRREANYWQVGWNGLNWLTPVQCQADRWKALGLSMTKGRQEGNHVLICGQKAGDAQHNINPVRYAESTITELRRHTNRELVWRPHPGNSDRVNGADRVSESQGNPLANDLVGAHCLVTHNSNSGHEALIAGVPVFCDSRAIYAECANIDLSQIERPKMPARSRYFYRLAYSQWTPDEMASGACLSHMMRFIHEPNNDR
jgi:hypothetical protein